MSEDVYEEDPSCIVQDLGPAGRNVNDWHWTEWNAMEWAEKRMKELFHRDFVLYESKSVKVDVQTLQYFKGDCCVSNRKKKIGAFYELNIGLNIKGWNKLKGRVDYGILDIPYIGDENEMDDFEVEIIRLEQVKSIWLKKKNKFKRLRKYIKKLLTELKEGACFKTRAEESIVELEERLKDEEELVQKDDE